MVVVNNFSDKVIAIESDGASNMLERSGCADEGAESEGEFFAFHCLCHRWNTVFRYMSELIYQFDDIGRKQWISKTFYYQSSCS